MLTTVTYCVNKIYNFCVRTRYIKMCDTDVLQSIPNEDIPKLRELYKKHLPRLSYIYNYLESVARWKTHYPDKNNYITLMAPHGNWSNGTFVTLHENFCYEAVVFTLENDCKTLYQTLSKTKKIKWNEKLKMVAVYGDHYPAVLEALDTTTFRFHRASTCDIMWVSKENALKFEINCPPEVYVAKLDKSHASIINSHWPHNYEDSYKYIATMIEMNGGCGVFLKSNGKLVAWVLRNLLGLGALQTADDYKRKGYGSLVTRALSKDIAEKGADPLGTVLENNSSSQSMFKKLGFELLGKVVYIESKEMRGY